MNVLTGHYTLELRLREHNSGPRGAKYTRSRRPVKIVWEKSFRNRSDASKAEYKFKKLARPEKLQIVSGACKWCPQ